MKFSLVHFQTEDEIELDTDNAVTIGRGELIGCSDKKVSRNHVQLRLTNDGRVHVMALHKNPCFVMKNGLPPILQLKKDNEKFLHHGDYIGLLPDSFWYKIVVQENEAELSNGGIHLKPDNVLIDIFEDPKLVKSNKTPCKTNDLPEIEMKPSSSSKEIDNPSITKKNNNSVDNQIQLTALDPLAVRIKELEPSRKLPLHNYEIEGIPNNINEIYGTDLLRETLTKESKNNSASCSDTFEDKIKGPSPCSSSKADMKDFCEDYPKESKVENIVGFSKNSINNDHGGSEDQSNSQRRPICQYEEKCYRKNEQHRRDFCHSGDPDFVPYKDRPVCQYGASCYRRNKMHWVEYRHPKKKQTKKGDINNIGSPKRKRQKKQQVTYSSEEDDYDLEDPFIDDGSSDEFVPSEWESDEAMHDLTPESDTESIPKRKK